MQIGHVIWLHIILTDTLRATSLWLNFYKLVVNSKGIKETVIKVECIAFDGNSSNPILFSSIIYGKENFFFPAERKIKNIFYNKETKSPSYMEMRRKISKSRLLEEKNEKEFAGLMNKTCKNKRSLA